MSTRTAVMKFAAFMVSAWAVSFAPAQSGQGEQAPPIIPKTPDVVIPPPGKLPIPAVVEVGAKPLSVKEAIAVAMRKSPLIVAAKGALLSAQGNTQEANADLLPQVGASAGYRGNGVFVGDGPAGPSLLNFGLTLSQLLYDFGRTRDLVRQQAALEKASEHELQGVYQTVALRVKLDFYALSQAKAEVALSEADVANRQRQLDEATAKVTTGIGAPSDLVQAKTNLASAAISLVDARNSARTSQIALAQDMGIDPLTPITPDTSVEPSVAMEGDLTGLVKAALNDRPDIRAAKKQVLAAEFGLSVARKFDGPAFFLTSGIAGQDTHNPLDNQTAFVGIQVTWNFLDGGAAAGRVKQARGAQEAAKANLIQLSQQAVAAVGGAFLDLSSAQGREKLAQTGVANASELLRISEGRYSGGIGAFLDITNAQNSLVSAQRNLAQAQADVQRARARLRNAIGLPD